MFPRRNMDFQTLLGRPALGTANAKGIVQKSATLVLHDPPSPVTLPGGVSEFSSHVMLPITPPSPNEKTNAEPRQRGHTDGRGAAIGDTRPMVPFVNTQSCCSALIKRWVEGQEPQTFSVTQFLDGLKSNMLFF